MHKQSKRVFAIKCDHRLEDGSHIKCGNTKCNNTKCNNIKCDNTKCDNTKCDNTKCGNVRLNVIIKRDKKQEQDYGDMTWLLLFLVS